MAMKNNLDNLKEYLFEALDVLTNSDLTEEELTKEAKRASAITNVADKITDIAKIQLSAMELQHKAGGIVDVPSELMGIEDGK